MVIRKKEFLSIPNILSYIRIMLIPLIVYFYLFAENYTVAAIIAAVSGLTDLADGFIARRFNMITDFGKFIDPVADKLTQCTLILCLLSRYDIMWMLVIIFFVKEISMALAGLFSVCKNNKKLDGAKWFGKVSTVVQFVSMTALFAFEMSLSAVNFLITLCAVFMLLAFVLYIKEYINLNKESK
ncbi:MAG: CDP-alcohol phosphatidyltransferase family protein [Clostridia bacterium]|nr:CDP-alcohol phosphatidyltransferase family protein [Clostridia bacterium]